MRYIDIEERDASHNIPGDIFKNSRVGIVYMEYMNPKTCPLLSDYIRDHRHKVDEARLKRWTR